MGYPRIATHPGIFAHPLSAVEAMRNWPARGNQVPDAHLAALLRQHGVGTIYTGDADFRRFDFLRIVNPFA
jgi:hypothetical protein